MSAIQSCRDHAKHTIVPPASQVSSSSSIIGFCGLDGVEETPAWRVPLTLDDQSRVVCPNGCVGQSKHHFFRQPLSPLCEGVVCVVGPREIGIVDLLLCRARPGPCAQFLMWLHAGKDRSTMPASCCDLGHLIGWYAKFDDAFELSTLVASALRDQILYLCRRPNIDRAKLEEASRWLARAAVDDDDMVLAAAGLHRAGSTRWRQVLVPYSRPLVAPQPSR